MQYYSSLSLAAVPHAEEGHLVGGDLAGAVIGDLRRDHLQERQTEVLLPCLLLRICRRESGNDNDNNNNNDNNDNNNNHIRGYLECKQAGNLPKDNTAWIYLRIFQ